MIESCESEVEELNVHVFIYHNVFWLDVSVNDSIVMHVFDCFNNLVHEEPPILLNSAVSIIHCLHEVEKASTFNIFHHYEYETLNGWALWIDDLSLASIVVQFDDTVVVQALHNEYFVSYVLLCS